MKLIIAEKAELAKAIAEAIPGRQSKQNGCIYVGDYILVWCYGHMFALKEPEEYDPIYKKWDLSKLPIYFPGWKMSMIAEKAARTNQIGELLKQAEEVIHAGDVDDEGQLIIDELLGWFGYQGKVMRLDTNDTTVPALRKALANVRPNGAQERAAGISAYARAVADLTVGINASRYFSIKNNAVLTVGRVQTPTLGLVVNRDAQIDGHTKTVYYTVYADLAMEGAEVRTEYVPSKKDSNLVDGKILDKDYAESLAKRLDGRKLDKVTITKKKTLEQPPLPFNLVKLQSYCSKRFGYSPAQVMEITQSLREKHKAITYNRTDSQYLSDEHYAEAPATMEVVTQNIHFKPALMNMGIKSKCFDSSKITAHFAIIPTAQKLDLGKFTKAEKDVYLAVCKYYMAQFMPPAEKEITKLHAPLEDGASLTASATKILSEGYLSIFKDVEQPQPGALGLLAAGTYPAEVTGTECAEKETRPPKRYTKASLNEDMTRIARYVTDPEAKKLLLAKDKDKQNENGSIGTAATRSTIVENLIKRGFLAEKGKTIVSTELGREFYRILPDELKRADMTARWWAIQEDIREGTAKYSALTRSVVHSLAQIMTREYPLIDKTVLPQRANRGGSAAAGEREVIGVCPRCGGSVTEMPKSYSCVNWNAPQKCSFAIWKAGHRFAPLAKKSITANQAKKLLKTGKVTMKGLEGKDGAKFEGTIIIQDTGRYVNWSLETGAETEKTERDTQA